jgi:quercetin dioxygenase-like cupin family protein
MTYLNDAPIEYDFGGSRARLLVPGEQTANAYCMLEISSPAGRSTPMHEHEYEDEVIIMLDGELEVLVDDERHLVMTGSSLMLPRGSRHQLINKTGSTSRYMVVCSPAGFERFVGACSDALSSGMEPRVPEDAMKARMRTVAAQFGITLYPPAPNQQPSQAHTAAQRS